MQNEVLGVEQVAELLKTTPRVAAEKLASGEIVGVKVGRHWAVAKSRVLEYIRKDGKQ